MKIQTTFALASVLFLASFPTYSANVDVTFTAHQVFNVGNNPDDNSESIFQGDPDLYFYMGLFDYYSSAYSIQGFFMDSPVSGTNWNFPDKSVSLTVWVPGPMPPEANIYFALLDEDIDTDDLLGDLWLTTGEVSGATVYNNNAGGTFARSFFVSEGNGWNNNYGLTYSVQFDVGAVPVPAAAWLFGSALLGLAAVKRKKA